MEGSNIAYADRVRGMIWGAVAASSLGVRHSGKNPDDLVDLPKECATEMPQGNHNRYPEKAWSALVEPLFVALISMRAQPAVETGSQGTLSHERFLQLIKHFAESLKSWQREGFRAWRATMSPYDCDPQTALVVKMPGYLDSPLLHAQKQMQLPVDGGSSVRAIAAALTDSAEYTEELIVGLTKTTHHGDVISATNIFMALALQALLHGQTDKSALIWPLSRIKSYIQGAALQRVYSILRTEKLENVGGRDYICRQLSVLRCFSWAWRACHGFEGAGLDPEGLWEHVMLGILRQGGATDLNCAIAGAVLGAWYGLEIVPKWHGELHQADWVRSQIENILGPN